MKIIFGEERLRLYTEGLLEELHLERFSIKHEGDITTCVISYKGPYTLLKKPKRAERKAKDSVGLYEWPEEDSGVGQYDGIDQDLKGYILDAMDTLILTFEKVDSISPLPKEGLKSLANLKTQRETLQAEYNKYPIDQAYGERK